MINRFARQNSPVEWKQSQAIPVIALMQDGTPVMFFRISNEDGTCHTKYSYISTDTLLPDWAAEEASKPCPGGAAGVSRARRPGVAGAGAAEGHPAPVRHVLPRPLPAPARSGLCRPLRRGEGQRSRLPRSGRIVCVVCPQHIRTDLGSTNMADNSTVIPPRKP